MPHCVSCKREILGDVMVCPHCGAPTGQTGGSPNPGLTITILVIVYAFNLLVTIFATLLAVADGGGRQVGMWVIGSIFVLTNATYILVCLSWIRREEYLRAVVLSVLASPSAFLIAYTIICIKQVFQYGSC